MPYVLIAHHETIRRLPRILQAMRTAVVLAHAPAALDLLGCNETAGSARRLARQTRRRLHPLAGSLAAQLDELAHSPLMRYLRSDAFCVSHPVRIDYPTLSIGILSTFWLVLTRLEEVLLTADALRVAGLLSGAECRACDQNALRLLAAAGSRISCDGERLHGIISCNLNAAQTRAYEGELQNFLQTRTPHATDAGGLMTLNLNTLRHAVDTSEQSL